MKQFTNQNLYGHLSFELSLDNTTNGAINNLSTSDCSFIRFSGTNPTLNGLDPNGSVNKVLVSTFTGTGTFTIKNESPFSIPSNRIRTKNSNDIILYPNEGMMFVYNANLSRWNVVHKETEVLILPGLTMNGNITQSSGFNNFSDGRTNLPTSVPLVTSINHFFDCSSSSFLRIQGGSNTNLTLTNMSEGQTVKIIFESTGIPYSINWSPYIRWGSSFFAGGANTLFPGDIPTPSSYFGAYDFYEITKIGGQYFGRASLDHL